MEGYRIPLLKGHGQALEQKHCFTGIFSDGCDASANLLNEFDGQAVPCACCFNGNWTEDVCVLSSFELLLLLLLLLLLYNQNRNNTKAEESRSDARHHGRPTVMMWNQVKQHVMLPAEMS